MTRLPGDEKFTDEELEAMRQDKLKNIYGKRRRIDLMTCPECGAEAAAGISPFDSSVLFCFKCMRLRKLTHPDGSQDC